MSLRGHLWTLQPFLQHVVNPLAPPPSRHFRTYADDPAFGPIRLTGRLHERPSEDLVLVVHGLGGSVGSHYAVQAAQAAQRLGAACLRLNLRGADRSGEDFYHAGLTEDLHAAVTSPELSRWSRILVLGYSLGGHVALRYAAEGADPRVRAVAAVCPPIDLAKGAYEIDQRARAIYRRKLLGGLKDMYERVAVRRKVPLPLAQARAIQRIQDWDDAIVAPRHGFQSAQDYYQRVSVAPLLHQIEMPALVVAAKHDPVVISRTVRDWLDRAHTIRTVFVTQGGHVGFPPGLNLNLGYPGCVEDQVIAWLRDAGRVGGST